MQAGAHGGSAKSTTGSSTADLLGGLGLKLLDNLKSALASDHVPPVVAAVSALMEQRANPETDSYLYLDPRSSKRGDSRPAATSGPRRSFQSAIVFMVGGGSMVEYLQLQQYARVREKAGRVTEAMGVRTDNAYKNAHLASSTRHN